MNSLKNKIAVITGGTSGIGYATAKRFFDEGAAVIITGRKEETVRKAAAELGVTGIVANQEKLTDIDALVRNVASGFKNIDILFLNAGITKFSSVETASEDHYDDVMNMNVKGSYFTVQKFLPLINDGGSIIFTTSVNAMLGAPESSVYAASKG